MVQRKIIELRQKFDENAITAYIIPQTDVHQNEYAPDFFKRLAWLTNFTGTAGLAIVAKKSAAIFVDGRYTLQAREQTDIAVFDPCKYTFQDIEAWLQKNLQKGDILGFDPWLLTEREFKKYQEICHKLELKLKPIAENLIDAIWHDRPLVAKAPAFMHSAEWSGKTALQKLDEVCKSIVDAKADAALLTQLDSVAWLLNLRGNDVICVPVVMCFAIVHSDKTVDLFVDPEKIIPDVQSYFANFVRVHDYTALNDQLNELGRSKKTLLIDHLRAPYQALISVESSGGKIIRAEDICLLPRACKNETEIKGAREAHIKDGTAVIHLLAWLAEEIKKIPITEMDVVAKVRDFRKEQGALDDSFEAITGTGPNGAIVHYKATPATNRQLALDEIFLVDSGGQYYEGTTDITRTVTFGMPTSEQKDRFTRVLKGHIQLACVKFPQGTNGHQLDSIARYALWQVGLDYAHGTGHGVGSYLCVHEGPQRISVAPNTVALQPGMILSNEPGYYKAGAYGIRIENLVVVQKSIPQAHYENEMLEFENLTLVPIDRYLIEVSLLTQSEREWLNSYHKQIYKIMAPRVQPFAQEWLKEATAEI